VPHRRCISRWRLTHTTYTQRHMRKQLSSSQDVSVSVHWERGTTLDLVAPIPNDQSSQSNVADERLLRHALGTRGPGSIALVVHSNCHHDNFPQLPRVTLFHGVAQDIAFNCPHLIGSLAPGAGSGSFMRAARSGWTAYFGGSRSSTTFQNNGDASIHGGSSGGFRQIAAKYPALLFKQQLDACMGKIFPMLRDNVKQRIQAPLGVRHPSCWSFFVACFWHVSLHQHGQSPAPARSLSQLSRVLLQMSPVAMAPTHLLLAALACVLQPASTLCATPSSYSQAMHDTRTSTSASSNLRSECHPPPPLVQQCIHAPRTSHRSSSHRARVSDSAPAAADAKSSPWTHLLTVLDGLRSELAANFVPPFLQRKLFVQLFSFINVQLFNQLLLRRECCSFPNGEYVKNGLAQVPPSSDTLFFEAMLFVDIVEVDSVCVRAVYVYREPGAQALQEIKKNQREMSCHSSTVSLDVDHLPQGLRPWLHVPLCALFSLSVCIEQLDDRCTVVDEKDLTTDYVSHVIHFDVMCLTIDLVRWGSVRGLTALA
jgi:hypothetical protein